MEPLPVLSVIIPTSGRVQALQRTLNCLCQQSLPADQFEVLVIEDGEILAAKQIQKQVDCSGSRYPYALIFLQQEKQGPTQARNLGASQSRGEVLVFLDDDICVPPEGLYLLYGAVLNHVEKTICLGALTLPDEILRNSIFARAFHQPIPTTDQEVHFTFCKTGLLALKRADFFSVGQFKDPTGGWPNWDDVDFGYRAHLQGYHLLQCSRVVAEHWDYASLSLDVASQRSFKAGKSAVKLFQVYPELQASIPMFRDMLPVQHGQSNSVLAARGLTRRIAATPVMVRVLKTCIHFLERLLSGKYSLSTNRMNPPVLITHHSEDTELEPGMRILRRLYIWVIGGYIYQGIQAGLRQYG